MVVVWIAFGMFGNHDARTGDHRSGAGTSVEAVSSVASGLIGMLPIGSAVGMVQSPVTKFRVEVASDALSVSVTTSTRKGSTEPQKVTPPWQGEVAPDPGYKAAAAPAGDQSTAGATGPTVSGIVTASAPDPASTVQCRVYADNELVLMSTGPGTVTCRVPASPG